VTHLYVNPMQQVLAAGGRLDREQEAEITERFLDFYEDIFLEAQKHGEVRSNAGLAAAATARNRCCCRRRHALRAPTRSPPPSSRHSPPPPPPRSSTTCSSATTWATT
jgi:hypothetical protein